MLLQQSHSLRGSCFCLRMEQKGGSENSNSLLSGLPFRDQRVCGWEVEALLACAIASLLSYTVCTTCSNRSWLRSCTDIHLLDHLVSEDSRYPRGCFGRCLYYLGFALQHSSKTLWSFHLWLLLSGIETSTT